MGTKPAGFFEMSLAQLALRAVVFSATLLVCVALALLVGMKNSDNLALAALAATGVAAAVWTSTILERRLRVFSAGASGVAPLGAERHERLKEISSEGWQIAIRGVCHEISNRLLAALADLKTLSGELRQMRPLEQFKVAEEVILNARSSVAQFEEISVAGTSYGPREVSKLYMSLVNSMTAVLGRLEYLKVILEKSGPPREIASLAAATRQVRACLQLTERLSTIELIETGVFDVNSAVERAIALKSGDLELNNVSVRKELSPDAPVIRGSPQLVVQMLVNLIENAITAMRETSGRRELRIATGKRGSQAYMDVEDTGHGIPSEIRPKLFTEPVSATGGMGVGLLLVAEIVARMSGSISYETRAGQGTVFRLALPSATIPKETAGELSTIARQVGRRQKVLVVDDEKSVASYLTGRLEGRGYIVDSVLDLDAAWRQIHQKDYDIVLLDVVLPSKGGFGSGLELLRRLQAENPTLASKVILVSAYMGITKDLESTDLPAKVVQKPFTEEELLEVVLSRQ